MVSPGTGMACSAPAVNSRSTANDETKPQPAPLKTALRTASLLPNCAITRNADKLIPACTKAASTT